MTDLITVRHARPRDTADMLDITRDVWGGHDYVPRVWNGWLQPHDGTLLVAESDGKVMGFQHVAVHPDCSAWMEGIRVRDDVQGAGVGTKLLAAGIEWARAGGLEIVRLSTSTDNPASNRMAERAGLRVVTRFAPVRVLAGHQPRTARTRVARPDELHQVQALLEERGGSDFYTEGWTAYRLTGQRLALLLAMDQVLVHGGNHIDAVGIFTATPQRAEPRPGLLIGGVAGIIAILAGVRESLRHLGMEFTRGQLRIDDATLKQMHAAGLERAWEHDMALWECRLG